MAGCPRCGGLARRGPSLEGEYAAVVEQNIRLVAWLKRKGLEVPRPPELEAAVPLTDEWRRMRREERERAKGR